MSCLYSVCVLVNQQEMRLAIRVKATRIRPSVRTRQQRVSISVSTLALRYLLFVVVFLCPLPYDARLCLFINHIFNHTFKINGRVLIALCLFVCLCSLQLSLNLTAVSPANISQMSLIVSKTLVNASFTVLAGALLSPLSR